jgi:fibronectin type 3 domain-containing protein
MTRQTDILVAVALAAAVGVVGCGGSTPSSTAPDTAPPAAVTQLTGTVVGDPSGSSVSLAWRASPELDVAGYRIYRRTVASGTRSNDDIQSEMPLLASVTQASFLDASVQLGQSYVYAVTAYDAADNESPRALTGRLDVTGSSRDSGDEMD